MHHVTAVTCKFMRFMELCSWFSLRYNFDTAEEIFELLDAFSSHPIHEPIAPPIHPLLLWGARSNGKPLENQFPSKVRNNRELGCLKTLQGKLELLLRVAWLYIHEINYMSGVAGLRSRDEKPSGRFSLLIITSLLKKKHKNSLRRTGCNIKI